jgi:hypothetical protein
MKRRRLQRSTNAPRWRIVEQHATCADGDHTIRRGVWALFWPFRHDRPRMVLCDVHAGQRGYVRAVRPFMMTADGDDVKAHQAGERD